MSKDSVTEFKSGAFTPKDELSFLFLQFQRALVLAALSICESLDRRTHRDTGLKVGAHILDLEDTQQISDYLSFLRRLRQRWLVRAASWIHERLDRSRKFKDIAITGLLYSRLVLRRFRPRSIYGPYDEWVEKLDSPTFETRSNWIQKFESDNKPLNVSVLVLPDAVKKTGDLLESIRNQSEYSPKFIFWGDAKSLEQIKDGLGGANGHQFVAFGDFADDLQIICDLVSTEHLLIQNEPGQLSKRSLHEVHEFLLRDPQFLLGYGDSDFLEPQGTRFHPKFHPDWNLRYFVGQNCFRGLTLVRREFLSRQLDKKNYVSWPELLVDLIFAATDKNILHIPKILFHSRVEIDPHAKDLLQFLEPHLKPFGAHIELGLKKTPRIVWPLPEKLPKVSILMPTRDRVDLVGELVEGILKRTDYPDIEIVIVDNQSSQPKSLAYFEKIQKQKNVRVIRYDFPFNYSAINNFGFKYCTGEILALMNNDMEVINPQWLKEAVREALAPDVGIVGAKLYFKSGFIQHAGVVLGSSQVPGHIHGLEYRKSDGYCNRLLFPHELSAVTGACMVMRREVFEKTQGFNERDLAVAYNDIDLCLRVGELGLKIVWTPYTELYHLESASRPPDRRPEQIVRYRREVQFMRDRWRHVMNNDPYYNPNLTREKCNFMVPELD